MRVDTYLERIAYKGPRTTTLETLTALQRRHMLSVPFENLDIHFSTRIALVESSLFEKIVTRRRGGFCYELNGLFGALLRELGFRVDLLSARVYGQEGVGPEYDHLTLVVHLDESWLVDVGFGDSFRYPMRLENNVEQEDESGAYRLAFDEDWFLLKHEQGAWTEQYRFSLTPRALADFALMCRVHETSPESHFTKKRVCTIATPDGRITLTDLRLITTSNGLRNERVLGSEEKWWRTLHECFGFTRESFGIPQ